MIKFSVNHVIIEIKYLINSISIKCSDYGDIFEIEKVELVHFLALMFGFTALAPYVDEFK